MGLPRALSREFPAASPPPVARPTAPPACREFPAASPPPVARPTAPPACRQMFRAPARPDFLPSHSADGQPGDFLPARLQECSAAVLSHRAAAGRKMPRRTRSLPRAAPSCHVLPRTCGGSPHGEASARSDTACPDRFPCIGQIFWRDSRRTPRAWILAGLCRWSRCRSLRPSARSRTAPAERTPWCRDASCPRRCAP